MARLLIAVAVLLGACLLVAGASTVTADDGTGVADEHVDVTDIYTSDPGDREQARDLVHTPDGGLMALVIGTDGAGAFETTVLRLGADGSVENSETVPGSLFSLTRVDTDAYAAAGVRRTGSEPRDAVLVRVGADGGIEWTERYAGEGSDVALDVASAPDGDAYLLSSTESFGTENSELRVLRVDEEGAVRWDRFVEHDSWVAFPKGERLADGSLVATVRTERSHDKSVDGRQNVSVARLAPDGEILWRTVVVGTGDPLDKEEMFEVLPAHGDGVLIAGASNSGNEIETHFDFWAAAVSSDGELRWQRQYDTEFRSFAQTAVRSADGYVLAGFLSNDKEGGPAAMRLKAIGADGSERFEVTYNRSAESRDVAYGVDWLTDGRLVVGGSSFARTEDGPRIDGWISTVEYPPALSPGPSTWETQHSDAEKTEGASPTATDTFTPTPTPTVTATPSPTATATQTPTATPGGTDAGGTDSASGSGPGFGVAGVVVAVLVSGVLLARRRA